MFLGAILAGATALVVAHNHPSGDPAPSVADVQTTRVLREAAKVIGIDLLDRIIVGDKNADPQRSDTIPSVKRAYCEAFLTPQFRVRVHDFGRD